MDWSLLQCKGEPPAYRDFHSATAIGDSMFIFGGRCDQGNWPGQGQSTEYYPNTVSYLVSRNYKYCTQMKQRVFWNYYTSMVKQL